MLRKKEKCYGLLLLTLTVPKLTKEKITQKQAPKHVQNASCFLVRRNPEKGKMFVVLSRSQNSHFHSWSWTFPEQRERLEPKAKHWERVPPLEPVCVCMMRGSGLCVRQLVVRICRGVTSHLCGLAWTYKPLEES